jgi:lipopolysaccharide export system permease protein
MIAALSLMASPWAANQSERYKERLEARDDAARISPGAFKESARGDRVFFVESNLEDNTRVQNVFVNSIQHGKLGIMVSKSGFTEIAPNGDKFLVMVSGRRYEGEPGKLDYKIMDFERYAVRIEQKTDRVEPETNPRQRSTLELLDNLSNPNKGEFLWRIGLPLAALVLALLAIPLSFVNPRAGRSINLLFALVTYMVYSNCISITQAWVAQGRVGFWAAWWLVHVVMFVLLLTLFWRRLAVQSVFAMLKR